MSTEEAQTIPATDSTTEQNSAQQLEIQQLTQQIETLTEQVAALTHEVEVLKTEVRESATEVHSGKISEGNNDVNKIQNDKFEQKNITSPGIVSAPENAVVEEPPADLEVPPAVVENTPAISAKEPAVPVEETPKDLDITAQSESPNPVTAQAKQIIENPSPADHTDTQQPTLNSAPQAEIHEPRAPVVLTATQAAQLQFPMLIGNPNATTLRFSISG